MLIPSKKDRLNGLVGRNRAIPTAINGVPSPCRLSRPGLNSSLSELLHVETIKHRFRFLLTIKFLWPPVLNSAPLQRVIFRLRFLKPTGTESPLLRITEWLILNSTSSASASVDIRTWKNRTCTVDRTGRLQLREQRRLNLRRNERRQMK